MIKKISLSGWILLALISGCGSESPSQPSSNASSGQISVPSVDAEPDVGAAVNTTDEIPGASQSPSSESDEQGGVETTDTDGDGFIDSEDLFPADASLPVYREEFGHRVVIPPSSAEYGIVAMPQTADIELLFRTDTVDKATPFQVGWQPNQYSSYPESYSSEYDFVVVFFPLNDPMEGGALSDAQI